MKLDQIVIHLCLLCGFVYTLWYSDEMCVSQRLRLNLSWTYR